MFGQSGDRPIALPRGSHWENLVGRPFWKFFLLARMSGSCRIPPENPLPLSAIFFLAASCAIVRNRF
jgi:hypothetical protein